MRKGKDKYMERTKKVYQLGENKLQTINSGNDMGFFSSCHFWQEETYKLIRHQKDLSQI